MNKNLLIILIITITLLDTSLILADSNLSTTWITPTTNTNHTRFTNQVYQFNVTCNGNLTMAKEVKK
jgi:hypothetical protein